MKTTFVLLGFLFALVQCHKKPGLQSSEKKHGHKKYCYPSKECLANGGYCIENSKKGDCNGILFSKECKSALCSCCIKVLKKKDECAEGGNTCPTNSKCQDKEIGYECACNAGFKKCGDINECDSNPCGPNSQCQNTYGSYGCVCKAGYKKVKGSCVDINECDSNPCGPNGVCSNSLGSFSCNCTAGYVLSGGSCVDINECLSNPCKNDSACNNTLGSYLCQCLPGYKSNGSSCVDVDDCASSPCPEGKFCTDKLGGYTCTCYACAQRCQYGAIYLKEFSVCMKLIHGNMTLNEARDRCTEDFLFLPSVADDETLKLVASYLLPNKTDVAWIERPLQYTGSLNGSCFGLTSTTPTGGVNVDCNSRLEYAVCLAVNYY